MDCYAAAIDAHMEEEDIVADQLKEYLFYGQALQELCCRHQMAQLEVEKAENHLTAQQYNKSRSLGQDGYLTKLWGKWTGTTETPEDRQAKLETIDRNIEEAQVLVQTTNTQLRSVIAPFEYFCCSVTENVFGHLVNFHNEPLMKLNVFMSTKTQICKNRSPTTLSSK